jgi:hypothetical protein
MQINHCTTGLQPTLCQFTLFVYNSQYTVALTYIHYSNKICITECELFSPLECLLTTVLGQSVPVSVLILTVTTINLR